MKITQTLLKELRQRLKVGNKRGVHLNAIPSRSKYKFDLNRLSNIQKDYPQQFIDILLENKDLNFEISSKQSERNKINIGLTEEEEYQTNKIIRNFENLILQTETIEAEKGINTFGFGFPLVIRKDFKDSKLTVAPVLIWSLRIKRTNRLNTFTILRNETDPIYLNEVLINHLENDAKIKIEDFPIEMLDDNVIDKDELSDICYQLLKDINSNQTKETKTTLLTKIEAIKSISSKDTYLNKFKQSNEAIIDFAGLFSIFEVQKQSIINDYNELLKPKKNLLNIKPVFKKSHFQSISSIQTDPSQQGILNSIHDTKNILIQGPPGTGKSQTLTAILVNALENRKKVLVVCEKRTALEVLEEALNHRNLNETFILIKDIAKDRRLVVNSVRDRVDNYTGRNSNDFKENPNRKLGRLIESINKTINIINNKHKKIGKKIFGEKSSTDLIGELLKLHRTDIKSINISKDKFQYSIDEYEAIKNNIVLGERLFQECKEHINHKFINTQKLNGEASFVLRDTIDEDFILYENRLSALEELYNNRKWWQKFFFPKLKISIRELKEQIENDNWISDIDLSEDYNVLVSTVKNILKRKKNYFEKQEIFENQFNWFSYYDKLDKNEQLVVDKIQNTQNWEDVFSNIYLNNLLKHSIKEHLVVETYTYNDLEISLKKVEIEQLKYIKNYWKEIQRESTYNFKQRKEIEVKNLYNKRKSKKHRRLSLREIVKYDRNLFTDFFPIVLTTPNVSSTLFEGYNGYFDIVLFDEASQLRVEDNLPSLLKGKQVIVAGDEHQMPPSNYFSKIFDGTIENEEDFEDDEVVVDTDNILLSCESLLEFGDEMNFDRRFLDFHYRSKHHYLIDFSNTAFYDNRLIAMPNKFDYNPIKFYEVNGVFENSTNIQEAQYVIKILKEEIEKLPNGNYPSVGIATFNISQRNLIKRLIIENQTISKDKQFKKKLIELEKAGLFVKNLENIQGDERDIIILSTTYGKKTDGKYYQRLGPINHSKGYKLLNVIITRAKYKIYVCSSIPKQIILSYNDYLIAEKANNRRGVFYAYLAYCKAVSENNEESRQQILNHLDSNSGNENTVVTRNLDKLESPFEEEVFEVLASHFGEDKLVPQYQFAGFRIDIVVLSSNKSRIAIECDGAKYHSSREAYLYDRHRQKILENQGFVFHRIWSTNWWNNSQGETEKLIKFIKNELQQEIEEYSGLADTFK